MPTKKVLGWRERVAILSRFVRSMNPFGMRQEIDALYLLLYHCVHDLDHSVDLAATQTQSAFRYQWQKYRRGAFLLSDPWFRENVTRILAEEELQIRPEWFVGKDVLDAGCGNGRWSYGLARLGARVTAVDVNPIAAEETSEVLAALGQTQPAVVTPLEEVADRLGQRRFDLVFCWGVLHHCRSFTRGLDQLTHLVKPDGILYLYLYGRESLSLPADLELFKRRVRYNALATDDERHRFLLECAHGKEEQVHAQHDLYAPLINRRLEYDQVHKLLAERCFQSVERTIDHTELFIRASRAPIPTVWVLPKKLPPYWFQRQVTI